MKVHILFHASKYIQKRACVFTLKTEIRSTKEVTIETVGCLSTRGIGRNIFKTKILLLFILLPFTAIHYRSVYDKNITKYIFG